MSGTVIGFIATVVAALAFFVLALLQLRRVTGATEPIDEDADEADRSA
ncbi:MAG: hypothetical protein R3320_15225 [Nitriliruptorales bacterium]|nr:hypothetical protein [Nitriliruptorales bacterium]